VSSLEWDLFFNFDGTRPDKGKPIAPELASGAPVPCSLSIVQGL
jgi:hypothetical protein